MINRPVSALLSAKSDIEIDVQIDQNSKSKINGQ